MDRGTELESLKVQMEEIKERMRSLSQDDVSDAKNRMKEYVDLASSAMKQYVDEKADALQDGVGRAKTAAKRAGGEADRYAHDNPWHVAAAFAVAGLALGALIAKDRR